MAKFRLGPSTVFTIGGDAVPCPTGFNYTIAKDVYTSDCAGHTIKETVVGAGAVTGSFSGEVDDDELLDDIYDAVGALVLQPVGNVAGKTTYTSTSFKVTSVSETLSSTGLTTYTANFVADDWTRAAAAGP